MHKLSETSLFTITPNWKQSTYLLLLGIYAYQQQNIQKYKLKISLSATVWLSQM